MELDRKVRWKNLRDDLFKLISDDEQVEAYKDGLYETPKSYVDGYAVNDGSWVKYYYNGKFKCKNKGEICRYLFGYVCFLKTVGVFDTNVLWYFSLCFLIDRLEYREGLFGCSPDNRGRIESTIRIAGAKKQQEVWTAKKDDRDYCLDPKWLWCMTVADKTRLQKKVQKKITDERIKALFDSKASLCDNIKRFQEQGLNISRSRLHQWVKENSPQ